MKRLALATLSLLLIGGCDFQDLTPSDVFFFMTGSDGAEVQFVVSTQFAAGVTEEGVTEVRLLQSDTTVRVLPVDTVVSIAVDRRFFAEVLPLGENSLDVRVEVDVDDRRLYERSGTVLTDPPFRYVYLFNQPYTETVDVVF